MDVIASEKMTSPKFSDDFAYSRYVFNITCFSFTLIHSGKDKKKYLQSE